METVLQQLEAQTPDALEHSVEACAHEIARIVGERQELRAAAADAAALEANRKQLADAQTRLSQLLIARYLPERDAA